MDEDKIMKFARILKAIGSTAFVLYFGQMLYEQLMEYLEED